MKEERILKKVSKLLSMYGVSDEEKEKFLLDLKDKKYDDQEEIEETVEEEEEVTPNENEEAPEVEEESKEEEKVEDEVTEEGEEVDKSESEEVVEEQPVEEPTLEPVPQEENPVEVPPQEEPQQEQPVEEKNNSEEAEKTIEALQARIEALEDIVSKMGVPLDNGEDIGVSPSNPAGESRVENEYDRFNRMRMGRR